MYFKKIYGAPLLKNYRKKNYTARRIWRFHRAVNEKIGEKNYTARRIWRIHRAVWGEYGAVDFTARRFWWNLVKKNNYTARRKNTARRGILFFLFKIRLKKICRITAAPYRTAPCILAVFFIHGSYGENTAIRTAQAIL